jgi:Cd2+/Zn2+-exporting ATPase
MPRDDAAPQRDGTDGDGADAPDADAATGPDGDGADGPDSDAATGPDGDGADAPDADATGAGADDAAADSDGPRRLDLDVPDMDCASCARKVEAGVEGVDGVSEIDPKPATGTLTVAYEAEAATPADVEAGVNAAGYDVTGTSADDDGTGGGADGASEAATDAGEQPSVWRSTRALKTYAGAVFLALAIVVGPIMDGIGTVATVLGVDFTLADVGFLAATAVAGQEILRGGYYSARNRQLDIDFLMTAAILAALTASVAFGEHLYFEAATLAVLFSVSELLETYAMDRTRDSLRELVELSPDEATVKRSDGSTETVLVEDLEVGDVVVVKPGESVPADGVVVDGESAIDESPVTGESVPVDKTAGDDVYAGTINREGYVEVEVTTPAGEDTLSRIVQLVEDAQSDRTEREQFVDRFASYYTPLMVAVAIGVAVVPPVAFAEPWTPWFVNGITMLVLACPCAFVISTPVSVVSGVTSAARNGVLVKGGTHLEAMGSVEAVAMDKTGTITKGELAVTDVVPIGDRTVGDVLACARGLESRSEHPIADAIVDGADGIVDRTDDTATDGGAVHRPPTDDDAVVEDFESVTGKGVTADLDGETHYAGKPAWFRDLGFDLEHAHVVAPEDVGDGDALAADASTGDDDEAAGVPAEVRARCEREGCVNLAEETIPRLQREGKTVVLVGTEHELEGVIAVADEIRPGARETVAALQDFGLDVVMLTGDNDRTARAVAESVGIDEYEPGLLPEEKVDAIKALTERYDGVAMVGDGVNDAPALATATVGIAMGAAGTDTAIETADIALLSDDVTKLPYLYDLSHQANGVIQQNIYASLAAKALLAVGVPLGYVSVALAVLAGDAGMTMAVTGNALRLGRITPDD